MLSARSHFSEKPQVWGAPTQGHGLPPRIPAKPGWPVAQACSTTVASGNVLSPGSTSRPLPPRVGLGSTVTGPCVPAYLLFGRDCVFWCSCHPTLEGQQAVTATWLGGRAPTDMLSAGGGTPVPPGPYLQTLGRLGGEWAGRWLGLQQPETVGSRPPQRGLHAQCLVLDAVCSS